jgi:hypothetical protein
VAVVVLAALEWDAATGETRGAWLYYALLGVCAVVVVVRAVRGHGRRRRREAVAPALRGLGEVQDLYLGRPSVPAPTYASPEGVVAELSMPVRDPLDDPVWVVDTRPATHPADRPDGPVSA